jgi:hypothetical protein
MIGRPPRQPVPLFHGRRWGNWRLDTERFALECLKVNYEIDLEQIHDNRSLLYHIYRTNGRICGRDPKDLSDLIDALRDIFEPDVNFRFFGTEKTIPDVAKFLKKRFSDSQKEAAEFLASTSRQPNEQTPETISQP